MQTNQVSFNSLCLYTNIYYYFISSQRLRFDLSDHGVLYHLRLIDPQFIFDRTVPRESVLSLVPLLALFPMFNKVDQIEHQYRLMQNIDELQAKCGKPIDDFWNLVGEVKSGDGELLLEDVARFGQAMLSLPHSSAEVERVFSKLNLIKTKLRNRLLPQTCESILLAKDLLTDHGGACYAFDSSGFSIKSTEKECDEEMIDEILSSLR